MLKPWDYKGMSSKKSVSMLVKISESLKNLIESSNEIVMLTAIFKASGTINFRSGLNEDISR